jgi:16S rRNA (guanine1207-N2)-methyltransferase
MSGTPMRDSAWRTLFHPFEAGHLEMPEAGERVLFLGAEPGFRLPAGFDAGLELVQGFRPAFLELERHGFSVKPRIDGEDFDLALVLAGRHRGRNETWIAEAARHLRAGGRVVVAASKLNGADSLRRRTAGIVPLEDHLSKHHGVVFWFTRPDDPSVLAPAQAEARLDGLYRTAPGMFSHGRVDAGSRLLAENLPDDISGKVADLGAGWGYLAMEVARRAGRLDALHLYEADYESCQAARDNLAGLEPASPARVFWSDVTAEPLEAHYDFIVMNPPFHHTGRGADPTLGAAMIEAAARGLARNGRLYMVANAGLPYEGVLSRRFSRFEETVRRDGFKLLRAWR